MLEVGMYFATASARECTFRVWMMTLPVPWNSFTRPSPDMKPKVPEATRMF